MSLKILQASAFAILALALQLPAVAAAAIPSGAPSSGMGAGHGNAENASPGDAATTIIPTLTRSRPSSFGVFGSVAISAARIPAAVKWQRAGGQDYTRLFEANCASSGLRGCDSSFARELRSVANQTGGLSERDLLNLVNRKVNGALRYREDSAIWGRGDYWATPSEMALKGAGDCEDFAIAKYWLLRSLGVADSQLQMVVLQDTRRRLFHAVLVVHTASGAYVLDNVSNRLQRDTTYAQYLPIMSFVGGKNYIHGFSGGTRSATAMPSDLSTIAPGLGM